MSELTTAQEEALRSEGQRTELFLAFIQPETVFACQANQSFSTHDMVAETIYDTATGTYTDILPGMTALVGSTAGASDLGVCRIRKAATSTVLYIGEGSSIDWADDVHITVLNDMSGLYPRHVAIDEDAELLMDHDIEYSDQHDSFDPVPVMGSNLVLELSSGTVDVDRDASDSWVPDSTISSHSWEVSPATGVTITGPATATPNIAFTLTGTYRVRDTVTAANGKISTGTRYYFVFDDTARPVSQFDLISHSHDEQIGGGVFQVRLYDQDAIDAVRDNALCILFERASYEGVIGSIGLLEGSENILEVGWIGGKSIQQDPEKNDTTFTVYGIHWWLSQMSAYPMGLKLTAGDPTSWEEIKSLTTDKALWHFCHWRTTLTAITDVYLTDDTRYSPTFDAPGASLWAQIIGISGRILANPISDRYSRLFIDIPHNLRPTADRSSSLDIMEILAEDHVKNIAAVFSAPRVSQVNLSTRLVGATGSASTLYSLSDGHVPRKQGKFDLLDMILTSSQSQSNSLAGLLMGQRNNILPNVPIEFIGNNRVFGLSPRQYATIDNDIHTGKLIPKRYEHRFNAKKGVLTTTVIFAAETFEQLSVDGDIPSGTGTPIPIPPIPPLPPLPPLPPIPPTPIPPSGPGGDAPPLVVVFVPTKGFWFTDEFNTDSPRWWSWNYGLSLGKILLDEYINIDMSRVGGRAFTHTYENNPELLSSPVPGEKWSQIVDPDTFWDTYARDFGGGRSGISGKALGVNRGVSDSFAIVVNEAFGSLQFGAQSFIGSSTGITQGAKEIPYYAKGGGHGAYGAGGWLFTYASWDINSVLFDADMAGYSLVNTILNGAAISAKQTRGGLSGTAALVWAGGYTVKATDDNFSTQVDTIVDHNVGVYLAFGTDPTGQFIAGFDGVGAANLRTSSDGGLTFGLPSGWVNTGHSIENCGDRYRWICESGNGIYYTNDFFATWIDKTGDLRDKCGVPSGFKAYMLRCMG